MPVGEARDRRGRQRGAAGLLERRTTLERIAEILRTTAGGTGRALLIEGHAGMGKTRLFEAALDQGRTRGLRVLHGAGAELERNFAFGVAAQLLGSLLADLTASERTALLAEAPDRIRALAGIADAPSDEPASDDLSLAHGLFTLIAQAAEIKRTLIAIDDLHWCDAASLGFLLYAMHRLGELPVAILMTVRPGIDEEGAGPLERLAAHHQVRTERLMPLGSQSIRELARRRLGERAENSVVAACQEVTAGNPFLMHELLLALSDDTEATGEELARRARALAPDAITRALRVRVGRLGQTAAELARAVAILGDDVPIRHAAALAGLSIQVAGRAADALAGVEVLMAREPLCFVHPLVRRSLEHDTPAGQRAERHLAAARLLFAEDVAAERVAAHLLRGRPEGNPWVVEQLRAAAREARAHGAPQSAVRYLRRALEEPPGGELRVEVLAELGAAEAMVGIAAAADDFGRAAAACPDPHRRAELELQRGHALYAQGLHEEAAHAYSAGLAELGPPPAEEGEELELHDSLQTSFVATTSLVASLQAQSIARSTQLLERVAAEPRSQGQRLLLAQAAVHAAFSGQPARTVIELADRGWDGGRMLERETASGVGWSLVTGAVCLAGELERTLELTDAVLEDARRRSSPLAFATACYVRGLPQLWQGSVTAALADLELARDARRYGWRQFTRAAAAHYTLCLIETNELDRAEQALTEDAPLEQPQDLEDALRLFALAELRLAQSRPREALELALATGATAEQAVAVNGYCPWRPTAAQAALALGERERALGLAREEVEIAERTDVIHARVRSLRVLGLCRAGSESIDTLRNAVELGATAPPRLETIRALVELGAALRRDNQRAGAREPLERAADMAAGGGAHALYERARSELAATGARPRRDVLRSGPASLTPSERRIAELAASGQSNREIALALFVTPKTVEYHLRNTYRKLGIASRAELAAVLAT